MVGTLKSFFPKPTVDIETSGKSFNTVNAENVGDHDGISAKSQSLAFFSSSSPCNYNSEHYKALMEQGERDAASRQSAFCKKQTNHAMSPQAELRTFANTV